MFAMIPMELPFFVILPAKRPIRPPAIIDNNNTSPPFPFKYQKINFFDYYHYIILIFKKSIILIVTLYNFNIKKLLLFDCCYYIIFQTKNITFRLEFAFVFTPSIDGKIRKLFIYCLPSVIIRNKGS